MKEIPGSALKVRHIQRVYEGAIHTEDSSTIMWFSAKQTSLHPQRKLHSFFMLVVLHPLLSLVYPSPTLSLYSLAADFLIHKV